MIRGGLLQDASGAVADLGVLVPISAALVLLNGLDPATVFVGAGALYIASGLYFKLPVPVQPIKAAAAIAIARQLPPETIAAAGICLGLMLAALSATGLAARVADLFKRPIVRGLQLGVGLILLSAALDVAGPSAPVHVHLVAGGVAIGLILATRAAEHFPAALAVVAIGIAYSLVISGGPVPFEVSLWQPEFSGAAFRPGILAAAMTMLVIPQVPLTFGNAVVAVVDLERRFFGDRAHRATPDSIALSCGAANVLVGAVGGMPMCHGSGGLTAHYRAGARTHRMNLVIGGALLALGLFAGPTAVTLLTLIPVTVLSGLLAFTGVMHSLLVADLRGVELAIAIAMGLVAFVTMNLAVALLVGMVLYWLARLAYYSRRVAESPPDL